MRRNPLSAYGMTRDWWRTTLKIWALGAVIGALLALATGCVDTLADAVLGDDGPKPDTVVVHCRHHDQRPECRR